MVVAGYLSLPTPAHKLALMKICDSADDRNRLGFPGLDAVRIWADVKKSRGLQIIKDLQELGLLMQVEKARRGRRAVFKVFPEPGDEVFSVAGKAGLPCPGGDRFRGVPAIPQSDQEIAALICAIDAKRWPGAADPSESRRPTAAAGTDGSSPPDPDSVGPPQRTLDSGSDGSDPSPGFGSNGGDRKGPIGPVNGSGRPDPFGSFLPSNTTSVPLGPDTAAADSVSSRPGRPSPHGTDSGQQPRTAHPREPDGHSERGRGQRSADALARQVADDWWSYLTRKGTPLSTAPGSRQFLAFAALIRERIESGYSIDELKRAVHSLYERYSMQIPSAQSLDRELTAARRGVGTGRRGTGIAAETDHGAAGRLAEVFEDDS
ncbi:hypothetical protein GCM10029978_066360 [Actinoallomurus acanthiterrae]